MLIQFAGLLHLLVAAANVSATKFFDYRENLRRVSPFVCEVFIVFVFLAALFGVAAAGIAKR